MQEFVVGTFVKKLLKNRNETVKIDYVCMSY